MESTYLQSFFSRWALSSWVTLIKESIRLVNCCSTRQRVCYEDVSWCGCIPTSCIKVTQNIRSTVAFFTRKCFRFVCTLVMQIDSARAIHFFLKMCVCMHLPYTSVWHLLEGRQSLVVPPCLASPVSPIQDRQSGLDVGAVQTPHFPLYQTDI